FALLAGLVAALVAARALAPAAAALALRACGRAALGGRLLLARAFLVGLGAVVVDVEAGALEDQSGADGGNAYRLRFALRAALGRVVGDAVEQLELVSLAAAIGVRRHPGGSS